MSIDKTINVHKTDVANHQAENSDSEDSSNIEDVTPLKVSARKKAPVSSAKRSVAMDAQTFLSQKKTSKSKEFVVVLLLFSVPGFYSF